MALTNAQGLSERSTEKLASDEHARKVFFQCLRLWSSMLPSRAGDDLSGELRAKGYHRMLGHLTPTEMGWLTEMVLDECKWFPTVAECKEMMGRKSYANRFHRISPNQIGSDAWWQAHRIERAANRLELESRLKDEHAKLTAQLGKGDQEQAKAQERLIACARNGGESR